MVDTLKKDLPFSQLAAAESPLLDQGCQKIVNGDLNPKFEEKREEMSQ